jgi:hypothetical protein
MFVISLEELDLVLMLLPKCLVKSLELVHKDKLVDKLLDPSVKIGQAEKI